LNGYIRQYFNTIDNLKYLAKQTVDLNINGTLPFKGIEIPGDGILHLEDITGAIPAYYCAVGYAYPCELESVEFSFVSPLVGSGIGLSQHQTTIILKLYKSIGGQYGSHKNAIYPIKYRRVDNSDLILTLDKPYTGTLNLSIPSVDLDKSRLILKHSDPTPFNLLSFTIDTNISDDAI
jgi:hypothetical protein